jgi:glycosyltransferase involved in cell wall biosynthesis
MKVLQIIYESFGSPFGFGGAGVRTYEIYKRLKDRQDITLLCMRYPGARDGEIQGLRHVFVGTESQNLTKSVLAYTVKAARFVMKYGRDFDLIVENFLPTTPFFSKLLTKTPVILQVQGIMEGHYFKKFSLLYSLPIHFSEKYYPLLYDKFLFVSPVTREKVMKRVKKKVTLCRVIPNGVDEELLREVPMDGDYILFFSRIDVYTKGLDILLSAFEAISPRFPDLRLVLAGYEFDRFARLTSSLPFSMKSKVEYAGFVTGDEKKQLLSGARMVVLPSRHESSPISIIEAAACGKPVIVSDIAELKFVEENNFGMGFPSGSADGLQEKIELLLQDSQLRNRLGTQGRKFARNCLWGSVAAEFENVLQLTVHEKREEESCQSRKKGGPDRR